MVAQVVLVTPDVVGPVKNGGIGTACLHYATVLARAGVSVDMLFTGTVEPVAKRRWTAWYGERGIGLQTMDDVPKLARYTYGQAWYTETSLRLYNYLKSRDYGYIIFQDWHGNGFWSIRAKEMGVSFRNTSLAVIAHSPNEWQRRGMEHHGDEPFERADLEWIEAEAVAAADVLISPSRHMIDWLKEHKYQLPASVVLCPIPFEDERRRPEPDRPDNEHLIFFGRLETRKGLHVLGGALRRLSAAGHEGLPSKVSFLGKAATVAGQPSKDYLDALQADLPGVEFAVHTDLSYSEAINYITDCNGLVIIPSLLDNFPLTVVESITNGFRFLASSVGGIPEIADDAVLFEPTADALARRLRTREQVRWGEVRHPYDPEFARDHWLTHVHAMLNSPHVDAPPTVGRARPPTSVCVPFYKHDAYLNRMVTAFLRESDVEVELVIVNDGTPPEESQNFERLRALLEPAGHIFVTQENAGVGPARNAAARLASHEHILFCDADNLPMPGMLAKLHDAMRASGADCVAVPFAAVPLMQRVPVPDDVWFHFMPAGGSAVRALVNNFLADAGALIKREVFDELGGFTSERRSWEDWEFFLRLLLRGYRLRVYPEPICYYSHSPEGRNESAGEYHNRLSLLASLRDVPQEQLLELLTVFVRDHLTRINRL